MANASFDRLPSRIAPFPVAAACLGCAAAMCSSSASAAILQWIDPAGGLASDPGNWIPSQFPTSADHLMFPLSSTYPITFNSAVPFAQQHTYLEGAVTLTMSSPHTTNALVVGDGNGSNALVTLTTGQLNAQAAAVVGSQAGSVGTLNINDDDATLTALNQLVVGSSGNGTLNITNQGTVSTLFFTAGHAATSTAAVNVSGAGSTLDISQTAAIGNSGDASLTIGALGHVNVAQDLFIGAQPGSVSQTFLNGGAAVLDVDDDIFVGINSTATAAGTGTLSATLGGLCFADTIFLSGDPQGGAGTLHIDTGGLVNVSNLLCGDANTTLDLDDGMLIVHNVLDPPDDVLIVLSSSGTPVVRLDGGVMTCAAATAGGTAIGIGDGSELFLVTGAQAETTLGNVVISSASDTAPAATLRMLNGATFDNSGVMHVGLSGDGAAVLDSHAQLHDQDLFLATDFLSTGTVSVGGGADVHVSGALRVGGGLSPGGTATLSVQGAGSTINANGPDHSIHTYFNGTVYVGEGAVFNNAVSFSHQGLLIVEGGVINTQSLSIGGDVIAHGAINGQVILGNINPDASIHASGGPLALGNPASPFGFFSSGAGALLDVDDEIVTIADSNGADLGDTTLNGGTLNLPDTSRLSDDTTLSGAGTVNGSLTNNGSISATGAGLRFGGMLTSIQNPINGTSITFLSTGGLTGRGFISTVVDADAGSTINLTGALTLGSNTPVPNGVTLDGVVNVGPHTLTLSDSNGVALGSETTVNGGTIVQSVSLVLIPGRVLRGSGTIQAPLVSNLGLIQPGNSVGVLNVNGAYSHGSGAANGDLEIEVDSSGADRLSVTGSVSLAGDLIVNLINGFVPAINQEYTIVGGPSISGAFSSVALNGAPESLDMEVIYSPTTVRIRFVRGSPCPADTNASGAVDVDDLIAVILEWGACDPPPASCAADIDDSGAVDVDDLIAVILAWGDCG